MKTKLIIAAALLGLAMPVAADFRIFSHGYEIALSDVRLPRNTNGTIAYKPCADCNYETKRISTNVRWIFNEKTITLSQFRMRTESLGDRDEHTVTVIHHFESDQVTTVAITVRNTE